MLTFFTGSLHRMMVPMVAFTLSLFLPSAVRAQEYTSSIGLPLVDGQFRFAMGIAIDSEGNIYVGDALDNRITKFDSNGNPLLSFGEFGSASGQLNLHGYDQGVYSVLTPLEFAFTPTDELLVCDMKNNRIQTFSKNGEYISQFGQFGTGDGQFDEPVGVAVDSNGDIYVSDRKNKRVQKFSKNGFYVRNWASAGTGNGEFGEYGPTGISVDANDNILVADGSNGRVQKFDSTGNFISTIEPNGANFTAHYGYLGITVDQSGNIFISDHLNPSTIYKFDSNGTFMKTFGSFSFQFQEGNLGHPAGLAADNDGNIYVVDGDNYVANGEDYNRIHKYDNDGNYLSYIGSPVNSPGQLDDPVDVETNIDGDIYVVGRDNNRVQKFDQDGVFILEFGEYGTGGDDQLNLPLGIATDLAGNIYLSDSYNYRVQKYNADGEFIRQIGEYGINGDGQLGAGVIDIVLDKNANLYTYEPNKQEIQKFDSAGNFIKRWSINTITDTYFFGFDIAIDQNDVLHVSAGTDILKFDTDGNYISKFTNIPEAAVLSFSPYGSLYVMESGTFGMVREYDPEGNLLNSWGGSNELNPELQFFRPQGMTFDAVGNLYVSDTRNHRVQVIKTANAPELQDQSFSLSENNPAGTIVGTLVATNPDSRVLTWKIINGNTEGAFGIKEDEGIITVSDSAAVDYETNPLFELEIEVSDGVQSAKATATITITDVNENPVFEDQSFSIEENSTEGAVIGTCKTLNADNAALSYELIAGNELGIISLSSEGVITLADSSQLDHESIQSLILEIKVTDGDFEATAFVTVNVVDVNETPMAEGVEFSIAENLENGTALEKILASDPDSDVLSFELISGNDLGIFSIDQDGVITVDDSTHLSFELVQNVALEIQVSDGEFAVSVLANITITNVNEGPVAEDIEFSIAENLENGTALEKILASDPDSDVLSFELISGNDLGIFSIDQDGVITVDDSTHLNFELVQNVALEIQVSDGEFAVSVLADITITNVNETPMAEGVEFSIAENLENGTALETILASDPDSDVLSFEIISGNDLGIFSIDQDGVITVDDSTHLDFELVQNVALEIQASDGEFAISVLANITITNLNERPVAEDQQLAIKENSENGSAIGQFEAYDPEGIEVTYQLISGNDLGLVAMDTDGFFSVADGSKLDHEAVEYLILEILLSDGELETTAIAEINIVDLNESPELTNSTFDVDENSDNGTFVGSLDASDPESDPLTFSISEGNELGIFSVDQDGNITVADNAKLDFEQVRKIDLIVEASDGMFATRATATVNINDVDEAITSLEDGIDAQVLIYPNPASDIISIGSAHTRYGTLVITSLSGKTVKSMSISGKETIRPGLNKGVYLFRFLSNDSSPMIVRVVID